MTGGVFRAVIWEIGIIVQLVTSVNSLDQEIMSHLINKAFMWTGIKIGNVYDAILLIPIGVILYMLSFTIHNITSIWARLHDEVLLKLCVL